MINQNSNTSTNKTFTTQQERRKQLWGRRRDDCIQRNLYNNLEPICRTFLRELLDTFLFLTQGKTLTVKDFIKQRPKLLKVMHKKIDLTKYSELEAIFIIEMLQEFAEKQRDNLKKR